MNDIVLALTIVGTYAATRMEQKTLLDRAGLLSESSVVQTPRARIFGFVANSEIGLVYYISLAIASFFLADPAVRQACLVAAALAAAMSVYLAYSLLFVTRKPCALCWAGHVVNWALLAVLLIWR
jgi:uncharacterized membrane protein